jgi:hypothetical protein
MSDTVERRRERLRVALRELLHLVSTSGRRDDVDDELFGVALIAAVAARWEASFIVGALRPVGWVS